MKLEHLELIEEFYLSIAKDYPDLTFEDVKEICYYPWFYTKNIIQSGSLDKIRLKGFGCFEVYPGKAKHALTALYKTFEQGKITSTQYFKGKANLERYLQKIESGEIKKQTRRKKDDI